MLAMLKYLSKFALDVLPSILATVIGAYIVNHYIVSKPDAPATAAVSTTEPKAEAKAAPDANIPEPGVRAKGISEKSVFEKLAGEKPAEKSADKPAETASIPVETRRHQPAPREKTAAKTVPVPQPNVPVVAAPSIAPPAEAATPAEEHRDANDLARAAIERLRGLTDSSPHPQEVARTPDTPRVADAPRIASAPPGESYRVVSAPGVRPLPPPIMVSTPAGEAALDSAAGSSKLKPPYADGPQRPTPPADIPVSRPLDLRAEAMEPSPREHKTVAEDMLSAAKSVFHAVLPK
jgi:hypothetical protein